MTIPRRLDNDYAAGRVHGYGVGYAAGASAQAARDRVAAFGAVRRALTTSRMLRREGFASHATAIEEGIRSALRLESEEECARLTVSAAIESPQP